MAKDTLAPDDLRKYIFEGSDLPELPVLDRSTLEAYGDSEACPFRARYLEERQKGSQLPKIVPAGQEVHQAISKTLGEYIDSWSGVADTRDQWRVGDIREALERHVHQSRPDVQPDAVDALMPSAWELSRLIYSIQPVNILAFDGGEDWKKSGQMAVDPEGTGVRITSELDLLYAGPGSPGLLYEEDWKSGWKNFTAATVADAFQFQMHAVLVFDKYPDCNELAVRVWNTRRNSRTAPVTFLREDLPQYLARIGTAIGYRMGWLGGAVEAWPSVEKCPGCPAAAACPEADATSALGATDAPAILARYLATTARADLLEDQLKKIVKSTGQPVLHGSAAFGPKVSTRAPSCGVYTVAAKEESSTPE